MTSAGISKAVNDAFWGGIRNGKDRDTIKMDMLNAGASIGNIHRTFMYLMKENDLYMAPSEKRETLDRIMRSSDVSDQDGMEAAIEQVSSTIPHVDEAKAKRMIVLWCRKNGYPYWTGKQKRAEVQKFMPIFLDFVIVGDFPDEASVTSFVLGQDGYRPTSAIVKRNLNMFLEIYDALAKMAGIK